MKIFFVILFLGQVHSIFTQNCGLISVKLSDKPISKKLLKKSDLITPYFHFVDFQTNYAVFMKNGLYGIIQEDKIIESAKYTELYFFGEELFRLQKDTETIITNCKGKKTVFKDSIEIINEFTCSDYLHYSLEGKEGIKDFYNSQIIPPIYEQITAYCNGRYLCYTNDSVFLINNKSEFIWKKGLFKIDKSKLPLYTLEYRKTECIEDTSYLYLKNYQTIWVINLEGKVIDSNYNFQYNLYQESTKTTIEKKKINIPKIANGIIEKFSSVSVHYQCFYVQNENDKFGIADTLGNLIVPVEYDSISEIFWTGNTFKVYAKKNGFWGVIDQDNNVISDFKYADEPNNSLWFPKAEKGNFFREVFLIDLYGREFETDETRCLPDPKIYR